MCLGIRPALPIRIHSPPLQRALFVRICLLVAVLLWPALSRAQESAAVRAARAHFQEAPASEARQRADLADLHPLAVHTDTRTGLTFVTLVQRYGGVEVFGATAAAAVTPGGSVRAAAPHFEHDLARRAGPAEPALGPEAAATLAVEAVRRTVEAAPRSTDAVPTLTDDPVVDARRAAPPVLEATTPRLGYHSMPDGALRLAWATVVASTAGPSVLRSVRLDAATGEVVANDDLAVQDVWPAPSRLGDRALPEAGPPFRSAAARAETRLAGTYRVVESESPSHGSFVLVSDPADRVASPRGWHNDGQTTYTTTRGNNVSAYLDVDADNEPDLNSAPDGGGALAFDFPFDPSASPSQNAPAAVTNLFYWTNVTHDIAFHYGFDEAAGNFQRTNFSGAGRGNDALLAEALDGSDSNNANFATSAEGGAPRMQMFPWSGGRVLSVTAPQALAGTFSSAGASFGPQVGFEGRIVAAVGPNGETTGCSGAQVAADIEGRVALVERGGCLFVEKAATVEALGAVGLVVYNRPIDPSVPDDNGGEALVQMGGDDLGVQIPSVFVQRSTGLTLLGSSAPVDVALTRFADRDSGLDAGVVVHEYAHGISNRLVGGPSAVECLTNGFTGLDPSRNRPGEQMGEGWSDIYALLLTQREGDTGEQPRGIGTYLRFETPDGQGVRNVPYSTDFAVNDYTYQDVVEHASHNPTGPRGVSVPHGIGFVWATMLWDLTWDLIDAYGYSDDLADASGTAGNQIALNLVTTGLKLTPCTPGFVDGRDAILAADRALYGGEHVDLIWSAFARRGLGVQASQGSPSSHTDGRASFLAPGEVGLVALSAAEVEAAVAPGASQTLTVRLTSERPIPQTFTVDAEAVPSWITVEPASGTLPANGSVELRVTVRPSPLETGDLEAEVPVLVASDARLLLAVRAATDGGVVGTHALSVIGPNPAREAARFTLATAASQTVTFALYDRLGRLVRTEAAALEAEVRQPFSIDVGGLASGLYVLRVAGETFTETRTLTVVR